MPEAVTLPRCVVSEFHMKSNGGKQSNRSGSTAFRARLERSRQSARECRARKKIRYQYLEELIKTREKAIYALREELNTVYMWIFFGQHILTNSLILWFSAMLHVCQEMLAFLKGQCELSTVLDYTYILVCKINDIVC